MRHKWKGNRDKGTMEHESSLQHGKRLAGKKTWKTRPESTPLLHSLSQSDKRDSADLSEHVDSDTSLDD